MLCACRNGILINLKMVGVFEQEGFEKDEILERMWF